MKGLYRCLLILICMFLWLGVWFASEQIDISAEKALYEHSFSFPDLLPNTDLYLWEIQTDGDGTRLLMQNIGNVPVSKAEVVFVSAGKEIVFEAEDILPGEKMWITEKTGAFLPVGGKFICTSYFIK